MQGIGGIMSMQGEPDGEPMKVAVAISDIVAGQFASSAILAALLRRGRTGEGATLEVSLLDAQVAWLANRGGDWLIGGIEPVRLGNAHPSIVPYETFRAADGYVNLAVGTDEQFARFCREAGLRRHWPPTPSSRRTALRVVHRERLVADAAARRSRPGRWRTGSGVLDRAGVPGGPVLSVPDALAGPAAHTVETVDAPHRRAAAHDRLADAGRRRAPARAPAAAAAGRAHAPRCWPRPATRRTEIARLCSTGACAPDKLRARPRMWRNW